MTRILMSLAIVVAAAYDSAARSQDVPQPPPGLKIPSPAATGTAPSPSPSAHMRILDILSGLKPAAGAPARTINDPTIPSAEIRELINQGSAGSPQAPNTPPPLPQIKLKARVFVRDRPPVAVVEIDTRQLTIRQGSEILWSAAGDPRGVKLRVAELTPHEIRIEVVERNQILTIE